MHCLLSVTGFQKRVTMGLFTEVGAPLASKLPTTLVKDGVLGCCMEHHSIFPCRSFIITKYI